MALIGTSPTMEVILLIIGIYIYDGGIIRKFGGIGLFITGLQLSYNTQRYVSDLTASPTTVSLFYTPDVAQAWVIIFATLTLIAFSFIMIDISKIFKFRIKNGKLPDDFWEYLV